MIRLISCSGHQRLRHKIPDFCSLSGICSLILKVPSCKHTKDIQPIPHDFGRLPLRTASPCKISLFQLSDTSSAVQLLNPKYQFRLVNYYNKLLKQILNQIPPNGSELIYSLDQYGGRQSLPSPPPLSEIDEMARRVLCRNLSVFIVPLKDKPFYPSTNFFLSSASANLA